MWEDLIISDTGVRIEPYSNDYFHEWRRALNRKYNDLMDFNKSKKFENNYELYQSIEKDYIKDMEEKSIYLCPDNIACFMARFFPRNCRFLIDSSNNREFIMIDLFSGSGKILNFGLGKFNFGFELRHFLLKKWFENLNPNIRKTSWFSR